jgi:hypothetical protein
LTVYRADQTKFMKTRFLFSSILGLALTSTLVTSAHSAPVKLDAADKNVAAQVEAVLRKRIKSDNGGKVNIRIVPTERASEGYFSEIAVSGVSVKLKKLPISEIALNAKNVQIDVPYLLKEKKIRTKKSTTTLRAVISDSDLTKMLSQGKHTADMKLNVKYQGDSMKVTGVLNYALIKGPVEGIAKLRQGTDHKVFLDIQSMKLRGTEIPVFMRNRFSNQINPVIDYEDLPFNPPFKSIKVVGNKAYLST